MLFRSGDVERAGLDGGDAFVGELRAAVDQAGFFCAVFHGFAWDGVVVGFVGLAQIGGVGVRNRALVTHPGQRGRGVETTGKGNADLLADRNALENSL